MLTFFDGGDVEILDLAKAAQIPGDKVRGDQEFAGYVGGWMTLDGKDRQGETLDQDGVDVSWFLKDGWFNDNHSQDPLDRYGYPVVAERRAHPKGGKPWWTEGPIFKTKRGERLMELLRAMQGSKRQFGFSVEGPPPKREGKRIVRAQVWNTAITDRPVHPDARITLVKSLGLDSPEMAEAMAEFQRSNPLAAALVSRLVKAMSAGLPVPNAADAGAVLQVESVDGAAPTESKDGARCANCGVGCDADCKTCPHCGHDREPAPAKPLRRSLSLDEAARLVASRLSRPRRISVREAAEFLRNATPLHYRG